MELSVFPVEKDVEDTKVDFNRRWARRVIVLAAGLISFPEIARVCPLNEHRGFYEILHLLAIEFSIFAFFSLFFSFANHRTSTWGAPGILHLSTVLGYPSAPVCIQSSHGADGWFFAVRIAVITAQGG